MQVRYFYSDGYTEVMPGDTCICGPKNKIGKIVDHKGDGLLAISGVLKCLHDFAKVGGSEFKTLMNIELVERSKERTEWTDTTKRQGCTTDVMFGRTLIMDGQEYVYQCNPIILI